MASQHLNRRTTHGVVRIGDTVRRPLVGDASFRHECLIHLERVGFTQAPRFLGIDDASREVISFIPGAVPTDLGDYTDVQIGMASALLRRFHDATASMPFVKEQGFEVACHNDWAPTNTVFLADEPVGMIDFDTAGQARGSGMPDTQLSPGLTLATTPTPPMNKSADWACSSLGIIGQIVRLLAWQSTLLRGKQPSRPLPVREARQTWLIGQRVVRAGPR